MARLALAAVFLLAALAAACTDETGGAVTDYEVTIRFNTQVTQDDLNETAAVLGAYDEEMEFLVMESFPPIGRAFLSTGEVDFCSKVQAEIGAKSYVDGVDCGEREDSPPSDDPDEPVSSP